MWTRAQTALYRRRTASEMADRRDAPGFGSTDRGEIGGARVILAPPVLWTRYALFRFLRLGSRPPIGGRACFR